MDMRLEPYAVKLRMNRSKSSPEDSLNEAIISLLERLAQRCMLEEGALIGHIKGFAKGPQGSWLRVSITDGRRPAEFEGKIMGRPGHVEISLNAHVLGLPADRIKELLLNAIDESAALNNFSTFLINPRGSICEKIQF